MSHEISNQAIHLFQGYGIEIEYMIVDRDSLDVRPVADQLIHQSGNVRKNSLRRGNFSWSNELVLHVIELKTAEPVASISELASGFQAEIAAVEEHLSTLGCRLLPGGIHPWMNPESETRLWPHDDREIYNTFDRIFSCKGHGWSNLQSTHLNLAFSGDEEFRKLHSAIRLVLPLIPALAASSPFADNTDTGMLDYRLKAYAENSRRFPSICARLIPEVISDEAAYQNKIYQSISRDLAPLDPDEILDPVWVNARGAIARFDRGSIEIRLMDTQECPAHDIAIWEFFIALLKFLVNENASSLFKQETIATETLADQLELSSYEGQNAQIVCPGLLPALGITQPLDSLSEVLAVLTDQLEFSHDCKTIIRFILQNGTLAERLKKASQSTSLFEIYHRLADCLKDGKALVSNLK